MVVTPPGTPSALPMVSSGDVFIDMGLVGVGETKGGEVRVGVNVRVRVGVSETVGVRDGVDVLVGWVAVGVRVFVDVGELPIVTVGVMLGVNVGVWVSVGVQVSVTVGVGGNCDTTWIAPF